MITFALLFKRGEDARQAALTLRGEGYRAEASMGNDGTNWLVRAIPEQPVAELAVARERMEALAGSLGGEFLGHGGLWRVG